MTDTQVFLICFLLSLCLMILVVVISYVFAMSRDSENGIERFSSEKNGAPFSPREYVSMGMKMIEEENKNDARKSDKSGKESAVNNK